MLQSMGFQRVGHNWVTEQQQQEYEIYLPISEETIILERCRDLIFIMMVLSHQQNVKSFLQFSLYDIHFLGGVKLNEINLSRTTIYQY